MSAQLDLFAVLDEGLCEYGKPERRCSRRATHGARSHIPSHFRDGTENTRAGDYGIDCCRSHANYYATAWFPPFPGMTDSCWIEVLP